MSEFGSTKPKTYIKKTDLKDGDRILFTTSGSWVRKDFSDAQDGSKEKDVYIVMASVNGAEAKELSINATSGNSLAESWGQEGPSWKDKIAKVSFVKMVCFGKMQDVLCLIPTSDNPKETVWEEER